MNNNTLKIKMSDAETTLLVNDKELQNESEMIQ